jgi:hypothetical protein
LPRRAIRSTHRHPKLRRGSWQRWRHGRHGWAEGSSGNEADLRLEALGWVSSGAFFILMKELLAFS